MTVHETPIPGALILEPRVFADERGWFAETYHRRKLVEFGIHGEFVQDNHSHSVRGTLRGLHFQVRRPQAKLCRVTAGEVLDVAVDLRRGSPAFGRWHAVRLSAENRRIFYLPRGLAHGFLVLSESADFLYKCDDFYDASDEAGILWSDPDLGIEWGVSAPLLSPKDAALPLLRDLPPHCFGEFLPPAA